MRRVVRAALLGALLAVGHGACGGGPAAPSQAITRDDRPATRAAFEQARGRWVGLGIEDYEYAFQRFCFCAPPYTDPVRIQVTGGQVAHVVSDRTSDTLSPGDFPSVDGLFALLEEALDSGAYDVQASYDPALGYPTSLYIDRDTRIADEELAVQAGGLRRRP